MWQTIINESIEGVNKMEMGIINGLVYIEGKWEKTNVYIQDEKIAAITKELLQTDEIIDATDLWVLPGLIDSHVHLHLQVGDSYSRDDFKAGTIRAAQGGVTTVIDFLQPIKTYSELGPALNKRLEEAKSSVVDYSFHTTIAGYEGDIEALGQWAVNEGLPSIKLFTTYSSTNRRTKEATIVQLLESSKAIGYRVLIHAENDDLIDEGLKAAISTHGERRPPISEISEVEKLAEMTEKANGYCYIVHTSCGSTVNMLKENYKALLMNKQLVIESCPHYFLMDSDVYSTPLGYRYVMTPPLRPKDERQKLNAYFDTVDVIGTDHCPYTEEEKHQKTLDNLPNGIEGMPYTLPSMFAKYGEKILPKVTHESAKIHGLYPRKGVIKIGSQGDIVLFDPNVTWFTNDIESPYIDIPMKGKVLTTLIRGHVVMDQGSMNEVKGVFIRREAIK